MKRLLLFVLGLMVGASALAADLVVRWHNPTQYVDNSPLPATDITQSRIEWGTCNGDEFGVPASSKIQNGNAETTTITGLPPARYCVRAYVTAKGVSSAASNVVSKLVLQPAPKPPVLETVDTVVYDRRFDWKRFAWTLGRPVGTIELGIACQANPRIENYFPVKRSDVKLDHRPQSGKLFAQCI